MTDWNIKQLSGSLGAEITGVNLSSPSDADVDRIKAELATVSCIGNRISIAFQKTITI